ncbi:transglycosylase domain-containing protein [Umezawaea beigongshangensis]|uniref:transglycosylase domain-containing protein n=1 Tax=Umezawaea beigongshangensis TaxID=2780383 RepID=UPI0018F22B6A|nr:transglycosylase domain-containing protein [Umezawaea beigongshangensis]
MTPAEQNTEQLRVPGARRAGTNGAKSDDTVVVPKIAPSDLPPPPQTAKTPVNGASGQRPHTPPAGARRSGDVAGALGAGALGAAGAGAASPAGGRPPVSGGPSGPGGPRRPGGPSAPAQRRNSSEEATEFIAPVGQPQTKREPDLLTHREPGEQVQDFHTEGRGDQRAHHDGGHHDGGHHNGGHPDPDESAVRKKRIWRRVRRTGYVLAGLMVLGPVVAFAIAYQIVDVPNPALVAADQNKVVTLYYSTGEEMAKVAPPGANRSPIEYEDLTDPVKKAVFAAEDSSFETNPGFDARAILRAVKIQVTGGDSGGSGLTQQYVKQATDNDQGTLSRKFTEVVTAYKMNKQQSKAEILTAYLNTIYFGRGAYGIQAASDVFFKKPLADLSHSEAALLAGLIQNPGNSEDSEYAKSRWTYVMGELEKNGWISAEDRANAQYPTPVELVEGNPYGLDGTRAYIQTQIYDEMEDPEKGIGISAERAQKDGLKIYTTIDPKAQTAAEQAVDEVMSGEPEQLRTSLSAINPRTGGVVAYWAGRDGTGLDYARGVLQEPGSSFKPFDLVAALQKGEGLGEVYDGSSGRQFGEVKVNNAAGVTCVDPCTVRQAMLKSVNTVFTDMAVNRVGTQAVANAAHQAGIPEAANGKKLLVGADGGVPDGNIAIGGGTTVVRPFDMAAAYATFAADGVRREPYFIEKIESPVGLVFQHEDRATVAFDADPEKSKDIAYNVTESLKGIPANSKIPCAANRECAGKTGTHELAGSTIENSKAWMVGYTPSLSASVWVGTDELQAIRNAAGKPIFGSGLPGQIWQKFMDKTLAGTPVEKFTKGKPIGKFADPTPTQPRPTTSSRKKDKDDDKKPPSSQQQPSPPTRGDDDEEETSTSSAAPTTRCRPLQQCQTQTNNGQQNSIGEGG